jgi:hypothetical protein
MFTYRAAGAMVSITLCVTAIALAAAVEKSPKRGQSKLVFSGPDGKLKYEPDENGNTVPDFSNCGYMGGGVAIPDAPVKVTLEPMATNREADDTARIQKAIDDVSTMPLVKSGLRGAVLLKRGTYRINGQLKITASGVVLRGEGDGEKGTLLIAAGKKHRDLIEIAGTGGIKELEKTRQKVTDSYAPVGSRTLTVADASAFKVGDTVIVRRIGNADWIRSIAMDRITPRPSNPQSTKQWQPFDLHFDRVIAAIDGNKITIDAPIVCAIDQKWGGGLVAKSDDTDRIENVGVEDLRSDSEFDKTRTEKQGNQSYASDEDHASYLVSINNAKNVWARALTTVHYNHGPAAIRGGAKWVTVQDCNSLEPVSIITGGRRYPYLILGQLNLMQRCKSDKARHAFVFGSRVCGPNVFLDCSSTRDYATSEPHHRWSVGGLYDNVKAMIAFQDRQYMGSGHGWAGANYVAWNCEGELVCQQPPTAQNWAIGFVGEKKIGAFPRPDGYWESLGKHVEPRSLYLKQLEDRLGKQAANVMEKSR